jgi:hypothetical protein
LEEELQACHASKIQESHLFWQILYAKSESRRKNALKKVCKFLKKDLKEENMEMIFVSDDYIAKVISLFRTNPIPLNIVPENLIKNILSNKYGGSKNEIIGDRKAQILLYERRFPVFNFNFNFLFFCN